MRKFIGFLCAGCTLALVPGLFAQMQIKNSAGSAIMYLTQDRRVSIGASSAPATGLRLEVIGTTKTDALRVGTSTAGQALVATGTDGTVSWGTVGSAGVTDNSLVAGDLLVNVVSSVDGVTNDGGNIDLVADGMISLTPNNTSKTITIGTNPNYHEQIFWYSTMTWTLTGIQPPTSVPYMTWTVNQSGFYLIFVIVDLMGIPTATDIAQGGGAVYVNGVALPGGAATFNVSPGSQACRRTTTQINFAQLTQGDVLDLKVDSQYPNSSVVVWRSHTKYVAMRIK